MSERLGLYLQVCGVELSPLDVAAWGDSIEIEAGEPKQTGSFGALQDRNGTTINAL